MAGENQFGKRPEAMQGGGGLRCEEWEALLADALDGRLADEQKAAFAAHSTSCGSCGELLARAEQGREWLGYLRAQPEVPAGLVVKILDKTTGTALAPLPVGARAGVGAAGIAMPGMAGPWKRNFHETRLMMTVAMAFFSIALTLNLAGVKLASLRLADLRPAVVSGTLSRQFYGARGTLVRYYDNLRFVYQLESQMQELRQDVEATPPESGVTPPKAHGNGEPSRQGGSGIGGSRNGGSGNNDGELHGAPAGGVVNAEFRTRSPEEARVKDTTLAGSGLAGTRVGSQKFVARSASGNRRFFAHHPRTEERSGPRSLRMTPLLCLALPGHHARFAIFWIQRNPWGAGPERAAEAAGDETRSLV
jgi:hypothetical protein